ncbi:MAG: hypothetical protein C4617_02610 [Candidatus Liberibacter europaeus]|uniref:Uncharacterized protein n=1 Tax=Candidatus Liberibacter europaeus TaxID=744859 RepID=A0A2T4VY75_9HYPH|nr:MAG: hypothetical protein C4617_02610 [Candidatus Liberibacter europaeus]
MNFCSLTKKLRLFAIISIKNNACRFFLYISCNYVVHFNLYSENRKKMVTHIDIVDAYWGFILFK